ncbi:MAG: adenylate kinase [Gaiella sp.]
MAGSNEDEHGAATAAIGDDRRDTAIRRLVIIATASGNGKTTLGRTLAEILDAPFVELDALHHGRGWTEATPAELRARVEPLLAGERWVIDGAYRGKLGDLVLEHADLVVWLDLPTRVWLPRLVKRTARRIVTREELWNGNRESVRDAIGGREALIPYALRHARGRRRRYPVELAGFRTVRLRSVAEVDRLVRDLSTMRR